MREVFGNYLIAICNNVEKIAVVQTSIRIPSHAVFKYDRFLNVY